MDWLIKNSEWLFSGIFVAVPIAVIGWFYSRRKDRSQGTPVSSVAITSHNQSGGITAQTVNFSPPQRQLSDKAKADNTLAAYAGTCAYVHTYSDSSEVAALTQELSTFLSKAGWAPHSSCNHFGDASIVDVVLEVNLTTEGSDKSKNAAAKLSEVLGSSEITSRIDELPLNPLPPNAMYLRVGPAKPVGRNACGSDS